MSGSVTKKIKNGKKAGKNVGKKSVKKTTKKAASAAITPFALPNLSGKEMNSLLQTLGACGTDRWRFSHRRLATSYNMKSLSGHDITWLFRRIALHNNRNSILFNRLTREQILAFGGVQRARKLESAIRKAYLEYDKTAGTKGNWNYKERQNLAVSVFRKFYTVKTNT